GRFDRFLDPLEEGHRFAAIDDAMVVGERDVHHGPNDDVALAGNGAFLNGVHAENSALRRIDDGCREQGTVNAAVADGKGAAAEILRAELVLFGATPKITNRALDFGEAQALGIPQNWNDQAFTSTNRHANVEIIAIDDISATHLGIDRRKLFEGVDAGLHEEGHEAEFHFILLEE